MTPETSMRRSSLITEILSGSEPRLRSRLLPASVPGVGFARRRGRWALVVGALLMACGCQSSSSLTRFSPQSKSEDISPDQKKSVLAILGKKSDKSEKDAAGLPDSSGAKSEGDSSEALLDKGENALAAYYKDSSPAHLTEAHQCYEKVLATSPGNPDAHHGLAIVCDLQKNYGAAEMHYRAALEKDPNNGRVLGDLGYSYLLQNKLSESEKTLVQATKLDPSNTQAFKNLGYVYAKQGNYYQAESTFRRAMNDAEVRQELAQLFPNGRPDMAKSGEQGKLPWQNNKTITTNEFAAQMSDARKQSLAELKARQQLLEDSSAPTLSLEQMKEELVQLAKERDDALRLAESRAQQSNAPLVLGPPAGQNSMDNRGYVYPVSGSYPQSVPNQFAGTQAGGAVPTNSSPNGQRYQRPNGAPNDNGAASNMASNQPPMGGPRRVTNSLYPNAAGQPGMQNRANFEQVSGSYGDPRSNEHALHQTNQGLDPRTGLPMNGGIQQVEGQGPLLVPNTYGNPPQSGNSSGSQEFSNSETQSSQTGAYEDAKRRAALAGMGGPEMMFNVPAVNVPQVDGGNRLAPGTGSTWNGGQYPQPQRMLPMDASPHDLDALSRLPSEQMTVQPSNSGMLNAPTGRGFSSPNFGQPLNPQIPLDSPLGNQGTNFQDQAYPSQRSRSQTSESGDSSYEAATNSDPRNDLNAGLQQYGQSMQYNSAQNNQNAWGRVRTPGEYAPQQPQVQNPNQLMNSGWNQQQMTPRITTPPPYSSRNSQPSSDANSRSGDYGYSSESSTQPRGNSEYSGYSQGQSYSSEPAPIYSPGVRVPASYNGGNSTRASGPYGQGYDGPRITPAGR